ncbi:M50 family metallopeptidase [Nocardia sp. NPDC019395]|uniref:M50 family metallopeptidase n=1 Tax=Nocardia sp. NPDC019395 TaxID=3154686 RepID=UPI0033D3E136
MDTGDLIDRSSSIAERLTTTQAAPPSWLVLATAVAALVLVGYGPLWRVTRNVVTIAHEGGHALLALLSGRRLNAITLHSDTSGLTVSSGKPYGFGMILTALAGYPAPPLVGLGFAALLGAGRITLMLWIAIAALVAMLVMIRNVYGVISVVTTGALVFVVSWFGSDELQAGFAYLATWLLLLAGSRPVLELQRTRSRMRDGTTDADQLARLTKLPGLLWVVVFLGIALGALAIGAGLLLSATAGICLPISGGPDCPAS